MPLVHLRGPLPLLLFIWWILPYLSGASGLQGGKCEPVRVPFCLRGLPYNMTRMPNLLQHGTQENAILASEQFEVLLQTRCSPQLRFFLCSMYAPLCAAELGAVPPCRSVCLGARKGCEPLLGRFNVSWPASLDCDALPEYETSVCVTPEAIVTEEGPHHPGRTPPHQSDCECSRKRTKLRRKSYLQNDYDYVILGEVLLSEVIGDLTVTQVRVASVLKQRQVPVESEAWLWTNSSCLCPPLRRGRQYLLLGWEETATNRLLFNQGSLAARWTSRGRLRRIKKWEAKLASMHKRRMLRLLAANKAQSVLPQRHRRRKP